MDQLSLITPYAPKMCNGLYCTVLAPDPTLGSVTGKFESSEAGVRHQAAWASEQLSGTGAQTQSVAEREYRR